MLLSQHTAEQVVSSQLSVSSTVVHITLTRYGVQQTTLILNPHFVISQYLHDKLDIFVVFLKFFLEDSIMKITKKNAETVP